MLREALALAEPAGLRPALRVFPLRPGGKAPLIPASEGGHGCLDATIDRDTIERWFTAAPRANLGAATGEAAGCIVIDVDVKHLEGKFGDETLADLEAELGPLPESWETLTPSGGRHLWFRYPAGHNLRNSESRLGPWLDVRANGGYVCCPPSVTEKGSYQWEAGHLPEETPLAELPGAWLDRLLSGTGRSPGERFTLPDMVCEGSRNATLFKYGASLRAKGMSPSRIRAELLRVNRERFSPPLDEAEADSVFDHLMRYPEGVPAEDEPVPPQIAEAPSRGGESSPCAKVLSQLRPELNPRYRQSDLGNGYLFADIFRDRARFVTERRCWFVYDGRVWKPDTEGHAVRELCKELANALIDYSLTLAGEKARTDYYRFASRWQKSSVRATVLDEAASVNPVSVDCFDRDDYLFNCLNGTLDLKTRELKPHSSDDFLTLCAGVSYDPQARCERWERFISEVMSGDGEKSLFLQKSLGYTLSGDTGEECFFILYGPTTRNGKSTCLETYRQLLGDYGAVCQPDTISQKRNPDGSKASPDVARLRAVRFAGVSEPDSAMTLSASLIKTLTGNDAVCARFLHENDFEFRPRFKIFINTNYLPRVTEASLFASGRVKVLEFARHFTEEERDPGLKQFFTRPESLSGILNWCLDGLRLYGETGLTPPSSVREATDQYRHDSDKISRFVEEELVAGFDYEVPTAEAYERYKTWCFAGGYHAETHTFFTQRMKTVALVERKRPRGGGEKTAVIIGYRLKELTGF